MSTELRFWKSVDELRADADAGALAGTRDCFAGQRAATGPPPAPSRRDFLTLAGFSVAAAAVGGCSRGRVQKAIPFLNKPEEITPGVPNWYATTCAGCTAGCSLLVKTRDGRPIKIEGNRESALFGGGTCAVGQATVLALYDEGRLKGPLWHGTPASWDDVDEHIQRGLTGAVAGGKRVVVLSRTILGPSTRRLLSEWTGRNGFDHVVYDAVSFAALGRATKAAFGVDGLPHYRFARARTIVGIEADFLGTWLSPVEFTRDYASRRRPETPELMSRHIQFESGVSVTGSNADIRVPIAPSQRGLVALALLRRVAQRHGTDGVPDLDESGLDRSALDAAAAELWRHRGESLVVCGAGDESTQRVVLAINALLGNVGTTLDLDNPSRQKQGDDEAVAGLIDDMHAGGIDALILYGVNPSYDYPDAERFTAGLGRVPLVVSLGGSARRNRVARARRLSGSSLPRGVGRRGAGRVGTSAWRSRPSRRSSIRAPRRTACSMARPERRTSTTYLRGVWRDTLFSTQHRYATFDEFWDRSLHDGVLRAAGTRAGAADFRGDLARGRAGRAARARRAWPPRARTDALELHLYESVGTARRPSRQQRVAAGAAGSRHQGDVGQLRVRSRPRSPRRLGLDDGDVVAIRSAARQVELPVLIQPGQPPHDGVGRAGLRTHAAGTVGNGVGVNAYPLRPRRPAAAAGYARRVVTTRTGRVEPLACDPDAPLDGRARRSSGRRRSHDSTRGCARTRGRGAAAAVALGRAAARGATRGAWRSISTPAPAARRAWSRARRRTTCRWSAGTKCAAAARCTGSGSIATTPAARTHPRRSSPADDVPALRATRRARPVCPVLATVHSRTASTSRSTTAASARATARTTALQGAPLQLVRVRATTTASTTT